MAMTPPDMRRIFGGPRWLLVLVLLVGVPLPAETPTIVIGTIDLPPHSVEDAKVPSFSRDLFREVFATQGWAVKLEFYPWARAFDLGKSGKVDAVWPSIHQAEREQWFVFGTPVLTTNYVLLKRRDFAFSYRRLEDAKPWRIGVLRGGITGSALDSGTDYRKEEGNSFGQNLQKLAAGRLDLMASERYNGLHLLTHDHAELADQITMLLPPISAIGFYLMFSKQAPEVEAKRLVFERGLQALRSNGRLKALLKQYGYDELASAVGR